MVKGVWTKQRQYLIECREELKVAHESGDEQRIALTLAYLGYAYFQMHNFKEGLSNFDESINLAENLKSPTLQAQCVGVKTLAYQAVERLPDAYKTALEIERLADENHDLGMKCDALASQGQILVDSGEPMDAFEKFNAAREIAFNTNDKRRQMNVMGALGNYSLTFAAGDQAEAYFNEASELARNLGDRKNEIGFLGNLGTVLEWKGQLSQAAKIFIEVLDYYQETDDHLAEIRTLRHLVQVYKKRNDSENTIIYARRGIKRSQELENDIVFKFYENLIQAYYRLNLFEEAHRATMDAIDAARSTGDRTKEVNFLLSLGESYIVTGKFEKALETYQGALEGARKLKRPIDEAYLVGRIGITYAEMDQVDEAIPYHQQALEIARQQEIPELEGEQLSMLAMAYHEKGEVDQARSYCETAIQIFVDAKLPENANNAQQLLAEIDAA